MAKGIIKVTPRSPGSLQITVTDPNTFNVNVGSNLVFDKPSFTVHLNDTVICTITSSTTCVVTSVVSPR